MNITITARGYKAPEHLKQYIESKLNKRQRHFDNILEAEVILSYEKLTQIAEVKMKLNNKMVIVSEKSDDVFKSVDLALDNIERQVKKYREKQREHKNKKIMDKLEA